MRVRSLASRILIQLLHDKRTLALMMVAPLFLLTLIYFIFESTESDIGIGTVNAPSAFQKNLSGNDISLFAFDNKEDAVKELRNGNINAFIVFPKDAHLGDPDLEPHIIIDGTAGSKSRAALNVFMTAKLQISGELPLQYKVEYLDGIKEISMFDQFGSTLIGFLTFFMVFLVGGMAFLKERKSGTLERLLSTPIKRHEIIFGYMLGFGSVTVIQAFFITFYTVYVLGVMMEGSIWYVLLITFLSALCALSLGMLISTIANSEFQVMQFIPLLILPQLFFCGLFDLSDGWMTFGKIFPLTYITSALNGVMFKNDGIYEIIPNLLMILGYIVLFVTLNILFLKKYRRI